MSKKKSLKHSELVELLDYSPETGEFTWKKYRGGGSGVGTRAGYLRKSGYRVVDLRECGKVLEHILAWFYIYGEWPSSELDHLNGIRDDNRIANLVLSNRASNCRNMAKRLDNSSGIVDVCFVRRDSLWQVQIGTDSGRVRRMFKDFFEACCFRKSMELRVGYSGRHGK